MVEVGELRGEDPNDPNKRHRLDTALWKPSQPGEPSGRAHGGVVARDGMSSVSRCRFANLARSSTFTVVGAIWPTRITSSAMRSSTPEYRIDDSVLGASGVCGT